MTALPLDKILASSFATDDVVTEDNKPIKPRITESKMIPLKPPEIHPNVEPECLPVFIYEKCS